MVTGVASVSRVDFGEKQKECVEFFLAVAMSRGQVLVEGRQPTRHLTDLGLLLVCQSIPTDVANGRVIFPTLPSPARWPAVMDHSAQSRRQGSRADRWVEWVGCLGHAHEL